MKKKSYNPFKMWGSWAGLIALNLYVLGLGGSWFSGHALTFSLNNIIPKILSLPLSSLIIGTVIFGSIGFLIGWGINSLWRKFK